MKKALLRLFLYPFILIVVVSFSFATKIHLKNGYTITGEIISSDETSVTIRAPVLGVMTIGKDKITKIEPPLEVSPEESEQRWESSEEDDTPAGIVPVQSCRGYW